MCALTSSSFTAPEGGIAKYETTFVGKVNAPPDNTPIVMVEAINGAKVRRFSLLGLFLSQEKEGRAVGP
jgi:hypothetical protein